MGDEVIEVQDFELLNMDIDRFADVSEVDIYTIY